MDQRNRPGVPELSASQPPAAPGATPDARAALDARYGRSPARTRRNLVLAGAVALFIAVVFTVWVIWAGPGETSHGLDSDDVGYTVRSNALTNVRSQVSVDPGTRAECAVQVLDKSFTIVGWKVVTLPASDEQTRTISTDVKTSSRGVTGLINKCWIP